MVFCRWRIAIFWLLNLSPVLGYKAVGLSGGIFSCRYKVTLLRLQSIQMSAGGGLDLFPNLLGGGGAVLLKFWKAHYLRFECLVYLLHQDISLGAK